MIYILFTLLAQSFACSPGPELACHLDESYYRYKVERIESSIPSRLFKVSETDIYHEPEMYRETSIELENLSFKPAYVLTEANADDIYGIRIGGDYWVPFKLVSGNQAFCTIDYEDPPKRLRKEDLETVRWDCNEQHDSCGGSTNHHPVEIRLYSSDYSQRSLAAEERKTPPNEPLNLTYNIYFAGRMEKVNIAWSIQLNDRYLHQTCQERDGFTFNSCPGKKDCWQSRRLMGVSLEDVRWPKPLVVTSKHYRVGIRQPKMTNRLFFGTDILNAEQQEEKKLLMEQFPRESAVLKKMAGETLAEMESEGKGTLSPEIVMGRLANRLFAGGVLLFDASTEAR